jgi:16S rRNA (adenine1518-N6/adenine1519-N6)-dimethyltransferase
MIPKKSLGQNFLVDPAIAKKIITSANLSKIDHILEIGPGKGILTSCLADSGARILAIEIDNGLTGVLINSFRKNKKVKIILGDILKINLPKVLEENNFANYKVVANLPYYITSKIIRLLLETKYPPDEMILMVQKEVGERICALDGKESLLSVSVKFYADPELLFFVPRENFDPVPEVDSVVMRIKIKIETPHVDAKDFFSLVRAGFSSKRKMLSNNLSTSFGFPKSTVSEMLKKSDIETAIRAEKLGVEDWIRLLKILDARAKD